MSAYETLDPADWEDLRSLGHDMIDDMISWMKDLRDRPVWQPMSIEQKEEFFEDLPDRGIGPQKVYEEFRSEVLPYIMGNPHPRFWAWYMGSSSIQGALADFLTSVTNSNAGAGNHVGQLIEDQVIQWMSEIVGYPKMAGGIIVSGGSMANFVGLAVARNVYSGHDLRSEGLRQSDRQMTIYASTEVHSCNQKALELMGIGANYFRRIPVNDDYTIRIENLRNKIAEDRSNGFHPVCIIGTAGTVNTGAIDDLENLAKVCEEEDLWFHVDGAIGAIAMLSDHVRPQLKGIERSDSVALDLHKWMHIPFEAGCVLVKDRKQHKSTFQLTPEYLQQNVRGLASGNDWYSDYGIQLSRRLKALKIWMAVKEYGVLKLGRMISRNVEQAVYLASLVSEDPELELTAPIGLDIVCYRYKPTEGTYDLNALNKEILIQIQELGIAVPSYTTLNGNYCIRVAIANHRSRRNDFEFLIQATINIGQSIKEDFVI